MYYASAPTTPSDAEWIEDRPWKMDSNDVHLDNIHKWHAEGKIEPIISVFHTIPIDNISGICWIAPSFELLDMIGQGVREAGCKKIVSVGAGSGLLEWMINQHTGIPVVALECKNTRLMNNQFYPLTWMPPLPSRQECTKGGWVVGSSPERVWGGQMPSSPPRSSNAKESRTSPFILSPQTVSPQTLSPRGPTRTSPIPWRLDTSPQISRGGGELPDHNNNNKSNSGQQQQLQLPSLGLYTPVRASRERDSSKEFSDSLGSSTGAPSNKQITKGPGLVPQTPSRTPERKTSVNFQSSTPERAASDASEYDDTDEDPGRDSAEEGPAEGPGSVVKKPTWGHMTVATSEGPSTDGDGGDASPSYNTEARSSAGSASSPFAFRSTGSSPSLFPSSRQTTADSVTAPAAPAPESRSRMIVNQSMNSSWHAFVNAPGCVYANSETAVRSSWGSELTNTSKGTRAAAPDEDTSVDETYFEHIRPHVDGDTALLFCYAQSCRLFRTFRKFFEEEVPGRCLILIGSSHCFPNADALEREALAERERETGGEGGRRCVWEVDEKSKLFKDDAVYIYRRREETLGEGGSAPRAPL
uniref:Uncharacterized protein n=1 Tax=Chromera velia CCMP2878 TaxID=1169474 RepID=A0A0G4GZL9_9ALVE|eukprot:Cvel_24059.t1-p1 / transcript=Cvel_24059.t1 / gene=Cvel_24059 / organism=Chromera_velia_CCMP2878 / gene_product=hypothetical protein / transcript_product=hypothetical protein / location=Cvel_scaffold2559:15470-19028(+) / protein_length=584 / sequence_SO=supercontig / SO=protein_coding / is_pseudo=false